MIKKRTIINFILICVFVFASSNIALAKKPNCNPKFVNPFSDVEWNCMFPIRIAGATLVGGDKATTPAQIKNPICACKDGMFQRIGLTMGFREPARLVDVTKSAFCLNGLGIDLSDPDIWKDAGAHVRTNNSNYFGHVHYYTYLPFFVLNILLDFGCMEKLPLDIAYLSEFDPLHNDELLGLVAFPETLLFASPPLIMSCVADAISAGVGNGLDALFWCAGGWGFTYPLSGYTTGNEYGWVESSAMVATKFLARSHRLLTSWGSTGEAAMCGLYPMPVIKKSQYKFQLVRPVRSRQCLPLGRPGMLWTSGKNPPVPGKADNFTYWNWRWRDCCAFQ